MRSFDVLIVGGGLVGASFALALRRTHAVGVIEAGLAAPDTSAEWDSRILAISAASRSFLESAGVWQLLDGARIGVCRAMQVHGDRQSRLEFTAYGAGVDALAWMVESRALVAAMHRLVGAASNIELITPAQCTALAVDARRAEIGLASGERLAAALVVGADGAQSWVRSAAGIQADDFDFDQIGVIANFEATEPHHGDAFQWFLQGGEVLAFLPLPGRRLSIVWSARTAHAHELLALAPEALAHEVARASRERPGALTPLGTARGLPLRALAARSAIAPRLALIGDAAHVVHPLAGQGVNLGFGDAHFLASVLNEREEYRGCGDARLLRRYQRARAEDILAMRWVTRGLHGLFALPGSLPAWMRNTGLNLTDRLPVIKTALARRALG